MTKQDIVAKISEETSMPQIEVKRIVQRTLDLIIDGLVKTKKVELRNFGTFDVKYRQKRMARNPQTGEQVLIPAKTIPFFKAGKTMKERVEKTPPPPKLN